MAGGSWPAPARERACELTIGHSTVASAADERQRGGGVTEPFYIPVDGPDGGPTCCASANHGPVVDDVAWKRAPSGLLVRSMERLADGPDSQLARVTVEVLGPVPAGEVKVAAAVERPGRYRPEHLHCDAGELAVRSIGQPLQRSHQQPGRRPDVLRVGEPRPDRRRRGVETCAVRPVEGEVERLELAHFASSLTLVGFARGRAVLNCELASSLTCRCWPGATGRRRGAAGWCPGCACRSPPRTTSRWPRRR
jgi:hypothetical protein